MGKMKIAGLLILAVFYIIYLGKMMLQKKKGIKTDQIARRSRKDKVYYTELVMKIATYSVVLVEVISIFLTESKLPAAVIGLGVISGIAGDIIFGTAVFTMKDNWRAGLAEEDKTQMVTEGIYRISRNPAFLGFNCVYVSILLMFFNPVLLLFSIFAMMMLHLQILQEEKYLPTVFGQQYLDYQKKVCRYIGRKRQKHDKNK